MPRKSKITAVTVSEHAEEGLARAWGDDDAKTDAEQMTDIINEVSVIKEPADALPEAPQVEAEAPMAPKVKAKRAPKKPPASTELEVEVKESSDETHEETKTEAKTEAKTESKVSCPDCGKQMSAKTLKHSPVPNGVAKKQNDTSPPISQVRQRESVMEEVIENEVQQRLQNKRSERAARREEMVQKLMQNAF